MEASLSSNAGNTCSRSIPAALSHSDGAAAVLSLASEGSETKDGVRRPPRRRPSMKKVATDTAEPPTLGQRQTSAQASSTRVPHSLAPPPRRKHRRAAQKAFSSTSSRTGSSSSNTSSTDAASSTEVGVNSRGFCERCLHKRRHKKTNLQRLSSMERASGRKRVVHAEVASGDALRSAHAVASRKSRVSRSSPSHCSPRTKRLQISAARRQTSSSGSSVSDVDHDAGTTDTSTVITLSRSASSSSSTIDQSSGSDEEGGSSREDTRSSHDSDEGKHISCCTSTADEFLSSSSSVVPLCSLTEVLPRDIYLHICSFLSEVDCCTLLEVSLSMHTAITCADSYVWRRLCMNTWKYKQGFQTFIQRVRMLEGLARREEREVQALQQHMLLLREQDTFFGESDVSATCDDATVLIRRRQHERAQWMAATSPSSSNYAVVPTSGFSRFRRNTTAGSSTTSASSETLSDSDEDDEERGYRYDDEVPHRRRGRKGDRHRTSKRGTHRSSTAAATVSTSRRSGKQSSRARVKTNSTYLRANEATERSSASVSRSDSPLLLSRHRHRDSIPSESAETASAAVVAHSETPPSTSLGTKRAGICTQGAAKFDSSAISNDASAKSLAEKQTLQVNRSAAAAVCAGEITGDNTPRSQNARSPCFTDKRKGATADFCDQRGDASFNISIPKDEREGGERKDRRVHIWLPEDAKGDDVAPLRRSPPEHRERSKRCSPDSGQSTPANLNKNSRQRHRHHSQQSGSPKRQGTSQPPVSRHRRSHSVKKRKPAKQRRRRSGRSRRPRTTGGGGGRRRSQHHRSQGRNHLTSRSRHHHNPKATKSTRRRRRRQRNAAAAAAAAANGATGERDRRGAGNYSSSLNASLGTDSGGATAGGGHGSTYFYQTPTYEAIKSTTPVLSVQHVAPALVPFQLGSRSAPLQSGSTVALPSPVASVIPRYPSRNGNANTEQHASAPCDQSTSTHNASSSATASRVPPAMNSINSDGNGSVNRGVNGSESAGAGAQPLFSPSTPSWNAAHGSSNSVAVSPSSLTVSPAAAADVSSLAPIASIPSATSNEENGLYWWQLTPEARQQQLRRMQQHEQRQRQQQHNTAASAVSGGPSAASPDGEEVANEVALREWDALEDSFGSSATAEDDDDEHEEEDEDEDESCHTPSNNSDGASATTGTGSVSNPTEELELRTWHSRAASSRLCSNHRRRSFGRTRRRNHARQPSSSTDSSFIESSDLTHTSPPSSSASHSSSRSSRNVSTNDEGFSPKTCDDSDDVVFAEQESDGSAHHEGKSASHDANDEAALRRGPHRGGVLTGGSGYHTHSTSLPRLSLQSERQSAKTLAKRYEAIEEAMVITRSKSILIHTLERQTHAHLPRLLAAAAAQRQRRVLLASRMAATAAAAAPGAEEASSIIPACEASGASARPVLLLGNERSPASPLPAASAAAATSTLLSSLSNSFSTTPGVALAIPTSPLHQLARISSSTALADGVVLHNQGSPRPSSTVQPASMAGSPVPEAQGGPPQHSTVSDGDNPASHAELESNAVIADGRGLLVDTGEHGGNAHDDDDIEEEEEPLAPVSWKFAYFMSRREARRATITLQDLLEGMWLVCFRSTGRTHPIRFTRQMQVVVYPPLKTAEEEAEGEGGGSAAAPAGATATTADSAAIRRSQTSPAMTRATLLGPNERAGALSSTAAAPPLPFHILQGGAQMVVHQFPPMKVLRRSAFAVQGGAGREMGAAAASDVRFKAMAPTTTTTARNTSAAVTGRTASQRTAAAEAEQRFLDEPQATLRRLQLRMRTMNDDDDSFIPGTAEVGVEADSAKYSSSSHKEFFRPWNDSRDAASVTQSNVRRFIAQQLGFAAAYVTDVLALSNEEGATAICGGGKGPLPEGSAAGTKSSQERGSALSRKNDKGLRRQTFFGPPTLKEFEARQRLEECFAPGGIADVLSDWGWTIASHHVKIFSLDVSAPLYVERLQRVVDVEVIGRSHGEARAARRT
ncbi:hypothetical protein ABL78_6562 [Leptomonas seymouri]|uniref:F-box domain-containing protein n=1 Tax=Leptomonas seymouri TaxID=5684 RepID=A0A0N1HTL9_LEPSE|nr:hypothetical protein ABL78_6562 [Leptomonas seymouri]|eukprot:KPI84381.1 hypothetical protein ABL78_6562 [Leptomonas seymouri]